MNQSASVSVDAAPSEGAAVMAASDDSGGGSASSSTGGSKQVATKLLTLLTSAALWLPTCSLWRREMVRFFRQRNRVIGAMATPLVFWLMLGFGMSGSFQAPGSLGADAAAGAADASGGAGVAAAPGYLEYFFAGMVVLILLFTAIFATITVIEDRREGFLQGVLASPIPRLSIVLGKVLGGASIATIQGALVLLLWPLVADFPGDGGWLLGLTQLGAAVVVMFILAMGLTGLGFCLAWPMDSTAGFHAIMNLLLMPMWFLSGAVFPVTGAPTGMQVIMWLNPLTYGHTAFAATLRGGDPHVGAPVPSWLAGVIMVALTIGVIALASRVVSTPRKDGQP